MQKIDEVRIRIDKGKGIYGSNRYNIYFDDIFVADAEVTKEMEQSCISLQDFENLKHVAKVGAINRALEKRWKDLKKLGGGEN